MHRNRAECSIKNGNGEIKGWARIMYLQLVREVPNWPSWPVNHFHIQCVVRLFQIQLTESPFMGVDVILYHRLTGSLNQG